jgi:hypothetical protein
MQAGGGLLKTKRFGKPESSTAHHSAKYCFRVVQNFTHRNWPAGELFSPKILLFNVEDRLIAGGFHEPGEPGEPGETRSDEIVD